MYFDYFAGQSKSVFYYPLHKDSGIYSFATEELKLNSSAQASDVAHTVVFLFAPTVGLTFTRFTYALVNVSLLTSFASIIPTMAAVFHVGNYYCLLFIEWLPGFLPFSHRTQVKLVELLVDSVI